MSEPKRIELSKVVFAALVLGIVIYGYLRERRTDFDPRAAFGQ